MEVSNKRFLDIMISLDGENIYEHICTQYQQPKYLFLAGKIQRIELQNYQEYKYIHAFIHKKIHPSIHPSINSIHTYIHT